MKQNEFFSIAGMAMDWLGGFGKAKLNNAIGRAQKTTDEANVYAQNLINNTNADSSNRMRAANNGLGAAQAALSNLQRAIGNGSKLTAFGKQLDANAQNLVRLQNANTRGSLEQGLRASEQLGALHAHAAASGTGGATSAMLHRTLELSAARQATAAGINANYQTYDMLEQRMGLMGNMVRSVDEGQSFAPIDYSVDIAPLVQSPIRASDFAGSASSQAWTSFLGKSGNLKSLVGAVDSAIGSIGGMFGKAGESVAAIPKATSLNMNDGWNNFSTKSFGSSSTEGLGSGFYGVGGDSNRFFSMSTSSVGGSDFDFKLK